MDAQRCPNRQTVGALPFLGTMPAMVSIPLSPPRVTLGIRLPTREELRVVFTRPSVLICAMLCLTAIIGGALFAIVWLAMHDKGTETIGALVVGVLGLVLGRLAAMAAALKQVQTTQTIQVAQSDPGALNG